MRVAGAVTRVAHVVLPAALGPAIRCRTRSVDATEVSVSAGSGRPRPTTPLGTSPGPTGYRPAVATAVFEKVAAVLSEAASRYLYVDPGPTFESMKLVVEVVNTAICLNEVHVAPLQRCSVSLVVELAGLDHARWICPRARDVALRSLGATRGGGVTVMIIAVLEVAPPKVPLVVTFKEAAYTPGVV